MTHPAIMLSLVDLLQDGRDEQAAREEPHKEESYHVQGLLEAADVTQELHDRIDAAVVRQVPLIVAQVETHQYTICRRY